MHMRDLATAVHGWPSSAGRDQAHLMRLITSTLMQNAFSCSLRHASLMPQRHLWCTRPPPPPRPLVSQAQARSLGSAAVLEPGQPHHQQQQLPTVPLSPSSVTRNAASIFISRCAGERVPSHYYFRRGRGAGGGGDAVWGGGRHTTFGNSPRRGPVCVGARGGRQQRIAALLYR